MDRQQTGIKLQLVAPTGELLDTIELDQYDVYMPEPAAYLMYAIVLVMEQYKERIANN